MTAKITSAAILAASLLGWTGCERTPGANEAKPTPASPPEHPSPGTTATATGPAMIPIPGGRFLMGDKGQPDATPHEVAVSAFLMDSTLVTQSQYQKVMGANPSRWKGADNPVEQVRWSDAVRFCNKRSELEGLRPCYDLSTWKCNFDNDGYRLPTEAEWEYACRAGTSTPYFFGADASKLGDYAWFDKNSGGHPRPVAQKKPNPWGLYDLGGDLWEWCNDFYKVDYYKDSPPTDPRGPDAGQTKVVRGGSWRAGAEMCSSAYRYNENPGYADVCFGYDIYGFRCVRKITGASKRTE